VLAWRLLENGGDIELFRTKEPVNTHWTVTVVGAV